MSLRLHSGPVCEPVTLAEVKAQLGIPTADTAQDAVISRRITEARELAEAYTRRALLGQTWNLYLDAWPDEFELPLGSLQSVDAITYVDSAGATQTLAAADYRVDTYALLGRVAPAAGASWPSLADETYNAVALRFTCGYGASSAASSITAGATTTVVLAANPGSLVAGDTIRLSGFAGADAALVNGLDHTINSVSGSGPYTFVLATNTAAKTITLGSGVGVDLAGLPGPIREAMLLAIGHWMNFQPGIEGATGITRMPYAVWDLLAPYRLPSFG
jgi:uncharacterized phiE125 gp8 family phage protein